MRFLLSVAAIAAALSGVSGQCSVKTGGSFGSGTATACQIQTSIDTECLTGSPAVITIPPFDTSLIPGAILDAVYINTIDADFLPTGTYTNAGAAPVTAFSVVTQVNQFTLFSTPTPSKLLTVSILQGGAIPGGLSVDPAASTNNGGPNLQCDDYVGFGNIHTQCMDGALETKQFQVLDTTFEGQPFPAGQTNPFVPDYNAAGTYVSFFAADATSTTGVRLTTGTPNAAFSSGPWTIQSGISGAPATIGTFFGNSAQGGVTLTNSITFSLKMQIEVQYDYHLPAVTGDPQFAGFQGQSFQVHGAPESYFALISAPNYYVNARFDYLSTGKCDYNETACFTHPGTYMGLIYVGMKDANILVQAGPHATGFAGVLINDKPMQVGDRFSMPQLSPNSHVHMVSNSKLNLVLDTITLTIHNSDLFVNFDLALTDKQLLTTGAVPHTVSHDATPSAVAHSLNKWYGSYNPLHGLIGQTWRNVKYADNKLYQGDITEYQLDKIVDHTFLYCVYEN